MGEVAPEQLRLARKRRRREARRGALLDAAQRLLAERGLEGFTMAAVAEAADVSKPSLYYYFDSKERLIEAIAERLFEREVAVLERAIDSAASGLDALEALVRERVRLYAADVDAFRILYVWTLLVPMDPDAVTSVTYRESARINDRLVERLERERRDGKLRPDLDLRRLSNLAWILAHGLLLFRANLLATRSRARFSLDALTDEACLTLRRAASAGSG